MRIDALIRIFGDRCITGNEKVLAKYSHDMVMDERYWATPAAIVFPTHTEEVVALMRWANEEAVPVTPRGAGSGLSGGAIPVEGAVVCSFEKMNQIIEIDRENMMVTVEPGVITNELDKALEPEGLFFAGYPMSEDMCYIGGNVAENAGGGRAIKYGVTSDYVIGAELVSPSATVLRLGGKRLKDVTGYNLLQLFVGSEGTLGLFTKIILKVIARPCARSTILAGFTSTPQASTAISELKIQSQPSSIEFMDAETALSTQQSIPSAAAVSLPEAMQAFLLVEYDAESSEDLSLQTDRALGILKALGGLIVDVGDDPQSVERVWALRKAIPWWTKRTGGGFISLEDVVVPPSAVPELVEFTDELRRNFALPVALFGHAGDGNFHLTPMKPEGMPVEEWYTVERQLRTELYEKVVALGGTISGEHGIGRKRSDVLGTALSPETIAAMRSIKKALDPNNILNPGVILS